MKLSRPTLVAFRIFKKLKFGNGDLGIPNGEVLGLAYESIKHKLSSIELDNINQKELMLYSLVNTMEKDEQEKVEKIVGIKTTLKLDEELLECIAVLQDKFKHILGTKRIYKPYVVKVIMLLAIEELNENLKKD